MQNEGNFFRYAQKVFLIYFRMRNGIFPINVILHFAFCIMHLPIIASVLGDNFLDGGDGAFDHRVVGLFGGDVLEPYAGGGD